jgi:hypothetical protein
MFNSWWFCRSPLDFILVFTKCQQPNRYKNFKKIGTDNEHTNAYLNNSKTFSKELVEKLIRRAAVAAIGLFIYYFSK